MLNPALIWPVYPFRVDNTQQELCRAHTHILSPRAGSARNGKLGYFDVVLNTDFQGAIAAQFDGLSGAREAAKPNEKSVRLRTLSLMLNLTSIGFGVRTRYLDRISDVSH